MIQKTNEVSMSWMSLREKIVRGTTTTTRQRRQKRRKRDKSYSRTLMSRRTPKSLRKRTLK
jgi:hypothetical protein